MKLHSLAASTMVGAILLFGSFRAWAQETPGIVWEMPTPNSLANSIMASGWSPSGAAQVAFGSTDRWMRTRQAGNGALIYSVLQPKNGGFVDQTIFSSDGAFLAVHNSSGGLGYRVHRAADGVFLGTLTATVDANGVVRFAPDSQLLAATGGDGTLSLWRPAEFTVIQTLGVGYDRTTTTFNFSADGAWQSAASKGSIAIRRTSDGAVVRMLAGGRAKSSTPAAFTPDSTRLAAWSDNPNQVTLWRISDGAVLMQFPGAAPQESVGAIRFAPPGGRMITTGYLPYVDAQGLWQQKGVIRFWRVRDGALLHNYSERTGIAVTSPIAWSPGNFAYFAYGTYEGTAVVALTPPP